jgi:hypothetical protein
MFGIRQARNRRDALNVSIGLGIQEDRGDQKAASDRIRKAAREMAMSREDHDSQ